LRAVSVRTYAALLAAARKHFDPKGEARQPADPYMTLVGYFNSLRELGGMRRLAEDEVRQGCAQWERRMPFGRAGDNPWFARHEPTSLWELTSRESTHDVALAKKALDTAAVAEGAVDIVLAS